MKKVLIIALVIAGLSLLFGSAFSVFAHGSEDGETTLVDQEAWEAMHEACEDGDRKAMTEAAEEVHGDDFGSMPCHDEDHYSSGEGDQGSSNRWGGMGGHMGGGMMGW